MKNQSKTQERIMEYTDSELLTLFRDENNRHYAFQLLVRQYQKRLYLHIRNLLIDHDDTDDVMQNTFIKIWESLPGFRAEASLYTWLYRIATNEALSFLKKKKRRLHFPLETVENQLSQQISNDPLFTGDEIRKKLHQAILSLPEKQRLIFQMKYLQEMKYEEIAGILDTSVGSLKASYHHAVKKIEKHLENY